VPYVNIKVLKEGLTPEKKNALIQGVSNVLYEVLDKDPKITYVVIDEVETDNWGFGGESVTEKRKKAV